ncbi:ATP-binding protein [Haliea sp. E17]|uniref:ATP-binding protein n=1 Tax=Haliea sp. E17 TaxID=3401576 RepID=UPI003AB05661
MKSLRGYLMLLLVAAFALVSFLAALNGYLASMKEAETMLDQQLAYVSEILDYTAAAEGTPRHHGERGFLFQVWRNGALALSSEDAPGEPLAAFEPGYQFTNAGGYRWRTFTRSPDGDTVYIVAERADLRHQVAERVVLESVLPWLIWLPVSALLIWVLVGWGLRPLRELTTQINHRRSDNLEPISFRDPPSELAPLIDSTNSLLSRLSGALERERHFASHAAHELRTPLSILKVHLHNLAAEVPAGHDGLAHARAGVERMHRLVEQILDLNRTNPEAIRGSFERVDLHAIAQRVTAQHWPAFEAKSQALSLNGSATSLAGDPGMLEILLNNLLQNANRYTQPGGEIQVSVAATGANTAELVVEDSGPGIPPEEREIVFQRFYRTGSTDSDNSTGSGLGLTIVSHIAQLHGGKISLDDSPLGGLRVLIRFSPENRQ